MSLAPFHIYREHTASLYHGHGLWEPDPGGLYQQVAIGDVGFINNGYFVRMFNVQLEWNDPLNLTLLTPEPYPRLESGPFVNISQSSFPKGNYCSRYVTSDQGRIDTLSARPDECPLTIYSCNERQGACLTLPSDGVREDVIRTKVFEDYIRDHVDTWFSLASRHGLGVKRMEDLILVTGCTLVTSWGVAAFLDDTQDSEVLLRSQAFNNSKASFDWRVARGSVAFQNSRIDPAGLHQDQCVFVRGFRAKRVSSRSVDVARTLSYNSDSTRENEIEVMGTPDVPSHRDPLVGVLDYIAENCPDHIIAISHDDDLSFIEGVDVLSADAVEGFLRQNEIGVLIENGAAILQDEEDPPIPDEAKAIFHAEVELAGEQVPLILHPVLSEYLLKIDISDLPVDYDHDLPNEELTSPAVHPPLSSLKLENHQGYPQPIVIEASNDSPDSCITVQDVLRTVHEDMKRPSRRREWSQLHADDRVAVDGVFRARCKTGKELGQGPCRIDYLRGRDRLQILPRRSPDESLPAPEVPEEVTRGTLDESSVAGPSRIPIR